MAIDWGLNVKCISRHTERGEAESSVSRKKYIFRHTAFKIYYSMSYRAKRSEVEISRNTKQTFSQRT